MILRIESIINEMSDYVSYYQLWFRMGKKNSWL